MILVGLVSRARLYAEGVESGDMPIQYSFQLHEFLQSQSDRRMRIITFLSDVIYVYTTVMARLESIMPEILAIILFSNAHNSLLLFSHYSAIMLVLCSSGTHE